MKKILFILSLSLSSFKINPFGSEEEKKLAENTKSELAEIEKIKEFYIQDQAFTTFSQRFFAKKIDGKTKDKIIIQIILPFFFEKMSSGSLENFDDCKFNLFYFFQNAASNIEDFKKRTEAVKEYIALYFYNTLLIKNEFYRIWATSTQFPLLLRNDDEKEAPLVSLILFLFKELEKSKKHRSDILRIIINSSLYLFQDQSKDLTFFQVSGLKEKLYENIESGEMLKSEIDEFIEILQSTIPFLKTEQLRELSRIFPEDSFEKISQFSNALYCFNLCKMFKKGKLEQISKDPFSLTLSFIFTKSELAEVLWLLPQLKITIKSQA